MTSSDLLFVYITMLRGVLDFAVPAYHSLLTVTQSAEIESLQRKALRIVYGPEISYQEALAISNLTTLYDRRLELTKKFALKTANNPRFSDGWFPKQPPSSYPLRQQKIYQERRARTERMRKNPICFMQRLLNEED